MAQPAHAFKPGPWKTLRIRTKLFRKFMTVIMTTTVT